MAAFVTLRSPATARNISIDERSKKISIQELNYHIVPYIKIIAAAQAGFHLNPSNERGKERMTGSDRSEMNEAPHEYASPACMLHEVDPAYSGISPRFATKADVFAWRKIQRQRLIDERKSLPVADREDYTRAIASHLDRIVTDVAGKHISLFWPFLGEPDLRGWMACLTARGAICLLPVVVAKAEPLRFRSWKMGERLERGVWNIPVPADGTEAVPDIVIAPLVGFDAGCFRLGYGGGFFDRTLAFLNRKPLAIGVGFESQKIDTIHPLAHDIPMDVVVTQTAVRYR
ncbi:5-formyltetrahydrofolate cyclo-ligase [Rhizobium sp. BR 362]|uniref:5-formyltetrahydrofolate cyclo-ligase n=1 Tax=Rhizobium sp. BR 362 TaxID=3040670 RepID=UPI002F40BD51